MIKIEHNLGTVIDTVQQAVILGGVLTPLEPSSTSTSPLSPLATSPELLFKYIHPSVTSEQDRIQIDKTIRYLVKLPMPNLCDQLKEMQRNKQVIATSIQTKLLFEELHRMGMPDADTPGYSISNLQKYLS